MSFLYRATPVFRIAARPSTRLFSTSIAQRKTVTEAATDALKAVDRTVSDAAVTGIDKTAELKDKAASVAGMSANEASGKASEVTGEVKGKAAELSGQAKGKAEELKGEAKAKI